MTSSKSAKRGAKRGRIRLVRNRKTGALVYAQSGGNQTAVDKNNVSLDSYIHALYGLALRTKARKALMIGCAGGVLASMLARAGVKMTVVDIDKTAFTVARTHFGLPRAVRCVTSDGLAYLQKTRARFDAVIVDAFIGERIPEQFMGDDFARAARRCLRKSGALFVNVCLDGYKDRAADAMASLLRRHDWRVRLIDQRGPQRNAIVMAGNVRGLRRPRLHVVPLHDSVRIARELKGMRFRGWRL